MDRLNRLLTRSTNRQRYLLTLLATALTIGIVNWLNVPNPAIICLLAVVFSTFIGGFFCGSISGFLATLYCAYFFSIPGLLFHYTNVNVQRMIVIFISMPAMILMVGTLKNQVDARKRELEVVNKQLQLLSTMDSLTGISNRRYFEQLLAQEWRRCLRDKTPLSLALVDIDFFKDYNDTYGHQAGDDCLRQVSAAIARRTYRPGDFTARYGGEEFAIIMSNTPIKGALKVGEDVRRLVAELNIPHGSSKISPVVTISVGVVSDIPTEDELPADFIKKADLALYHAKRCGRNRVQAYSEDEEAYCTFK